jgi:glycosyltransferase involved in cell wall biosynthesis
MISLPEPRLAPPAELNIDVPPRAECVLSVVIPVRDEETSLPATLAALAAQQDADGSLLDPRLYEIILLVNNSVDGSAAIARSFAKRHP